MLFDELTYPYQTVPPATVKNVVAPPTGDGMGVGEPGRHEGQIARALKNDGRRRGRGGDLREEGGGGVATTRWQHG